MITLKVTEAVSLLDKIKGLIGNTHPESLLIKTRFGIHTFGISFPIDILILDQNKKVVGIKKNLPPNRLFFWNPRYDTVLELPKSTINKKGIKQRDRIKLISSGTNPVNFTQ